MPRLTLLLDFIMMSLLTSGGALDSQTSDTQFFGGFETVESQAKDAQYPANPLPTRELNTIVADIRKAREDLAALENELVTACLIAAAGNHEVQCT